MIKRHQLFNDFCQKWKHQLALSATIAMFKSISDDDLATMYNLKVFRKGMFIN
jgi:hypothetical protein